MAVARLAGQGASARKYDLLTVIGAAGLAGSPLDQRMALRLMTLITARYDWRRDLLSTGQREIARLWSVDERTVKREMSKLRERGWLVLRRQGARGRVSEYALGMARLLDDTRPYWALVGSDLEDRLDEATSSVPAGTEKNVIPFPAPAATGDTWGTAMAEIATESPALYATWLQHLKVLYITDEEIILQAPSRFHATYVQTHLSLRLLSLCSKRNPSLRGLRIES